jgi:glycerol kinase
MTAQSPAPLGTLYADGGASRSDFLMQCVADILGHPVVQSDAPEVSALGAAYLAGLSAGIWPDLATVAALPRGGRVIHPGASDAAERLRTWNDAVHRATVPRAGTGNG